MESPGLNYNLCLCKGIQLFLEGRLKYAREQFELCLLHCSDKKEACLYIGITCIRLYFENNNTQDQAQLRDTVGRVLTTCV